MRNSRTKKGFGRELAFLELGTIGLFLRLRPVVSNGSVFVAWQHRATFL
jgi:hypothetical protein